MKEDIKSMTLPELTTWMSALGEKGFRAKQLYNWMHKNLVSSFDEMTNLSGALKSKLKEQADFVVLTPVDVRISSIDGTRKYLFRLQDGNVIESVLMRYRFGNSVCISTQVGCRMGCRFCASTLDGLVRSLRPSEMLEQIYRIQKDIGERISNVVLMGSGEPFDNTENVFRFLDLISCEEGLNISQRNLTISTCGLIPGIEQLTARHSQVTLALSLHAPNDTVRKELMPIANKYHIQDVLAACKKYFEVTGRRVTFEYSLVAGVNDNEDEARQLAALLNGFPCHVNLIPVNPIKERNYVQSGQVQIEKFKKLLEKSAIHVTIRREISCKSDIGRMRSQNQDSVFASDKPVGKLPNLLIVADGMGGHKAGDFASRYAVEKLVECISESVYENPLLIVSDAIRVVNRRIYEKSQDYEEYRGMGTTLTLAFVDEASKLHVFQVGDSRLYLISDTIRQITKDHSYVEEMYRKGLITRDSEEYQSKKNIITRALGSHDYTAADIFEEPVVPGDLLLLCSDGLTNMVGDDAIFEIAKGAASLEEKTNVLIEQANENGGQDNISVILASVE